MYDLSANRDAVSKSKKMSTTVERKTDKNLQNQLLGM